MTNNTKNILIRFGKYLGAAVISAVVMLLLSPDFANVIPTAYTFLVPAIIIPVLVELDKKFFGQTPSTTPPAPPVTK